MAMATIPGYNTTTGAVARSFKWAMAERASDTPELAASEKQEYQRCPLTSGGGFIGWSPTCPTRLPEDEGWQVRSSRHLRHGWADTLGRRRTAKARALHAGHESMCGEAMGSLTRKKDYRILHSLSLALSG